MSTPPLTEYQRAVFATTARLLSCFVTESLVRALYIPLEGLEATGFSVLLTGSVSASSQPEWPSYTAADILAIVLLKHVPVLTNEGSYRRAREVGLLDPLDMLPLVFEVGQSGDIGSRQDEVSPVNILALAIDSATTP